MKLSHFTVHFIPLIEQGITAIDTLQAKREEAKKRIDAEKAKLSSDVLVFQVCKHKRNFEIMSHFVFDVHVCGQDEHGKLIEGQDKEYEKRSTELNTQYKEAAIKMKSCFDAFKKNAQIIYRSTKALSQKGAAARAKSALRKNDYIDAMQDAFRNCRSNCTSYLKDTEKKVLQAKKTKNGLILSMAFLLLLHSSLWFVFVNIELSTLSNGQI